ncbi:hypothetical protein [Novosphingobium sp. M1R2S20]|uniref:Lipoprotein n=1 Tax=Novosphingobium rhizovicinum TaxID=3228928 RepID=A0ABV3REA4_9SPHN
MKRSISVGLLALSLAACEQTPPDAPTPPSDEASSAHQAQLSPVTAQPEQTDEGDAANPQGLSPEGVGDIIVGQAPPPSLKEDEVQVSDSCRTYSDKPRRLYAITDGSVVTRITLMDGSTIKTQRGIGVGASEDAVIKAYPDAVSKPHEYVAAPAKYLDWRPNGAASGLRFEIDADGKVNLIHAGREPYLTYTEGCV